MKSSIIRSVVPSFILALLGGCAAAHGGVDGEHPESAAQALGALPAGSFTAIIQSATTNACLIFSGNGTDRYPSRYLWGNGTDPTNCGFGSQAEMVQNKQAVFTFIPVQNDQYIITNASNGSTQCLIFSGNGTDTYPSRYVWGNGTNPTNCGFASQAELLQNRQAIWRIVPLQGNQYAITSAADGNERCLIFSGNGTDPYPSRYLWGNGTSLTNCGFSSLTEELNNKQAVWTIAPIVATNPNVNLTVNPTLGWVDSLAIGSQEILCGKTDSYSLSRCSMSVAPNTWIELTARPPTGVTFQGWGPGPCAGMGQVCQFQLGADTSITANFAQSGSATLTVVRPSNGNVEGDQITCGDSDSWSANNCSETVTKGTTITLWSYTKMGYRFAGWGGACSGTNASCTLTIQSDTQVSASYAPIDPPPPPGNSTITVDPTLGWVDSLAVGWNEILCGRTDSYTQNRCSMTVANGTYIELTARPPTGTVFQGWSAGSVCAGQGQVCEFRLMNNVSLSASFAQIGTASLTVTRPTGGNVEGGAITCGDSDSWSANNCSETATSGTSITLWSYPKMGYRFVGWGGACSGTSADCTLTLAGTMNVTAQFAPN